MNEVITIGVDLAKNVFQVHGVDAEGAVIFRRQLRRGQMVPFFKKQPLCLVGMEACATSHRQSHDKAAATARNSLIHGKKPHQTSPETKNRLGRSLRRKPECPLLLYPDNKTQLRSDFFNSLGYKQTHSARQKYVWFCAVTGRHN